MPETKEVQTAKKKNSKQPKTIPELAKELIAIKHQEKQVREQLIRTVDVKRKAASLAIKQARGLYPVKNQHVQPREHNHIPSVVFRRTKK